MTVAVPWPARAQSATGAPARQPAALVQLTASAEPAPDPRDVLPGVLSRVGPADRAERAARQIVTAVGSADGVRIQRYLVARGHSAPAVAATLRSAGVVAEINEVVPVIGPSAVRLSREPRGADQWGASLIRAEGAWRRSTGRGVVVAVVDTGVDATHPDVRKRVLPQINIPRDRRTGDVNGHGTHVAGIIAAAANGIGTVGVAPNSRILPVRVFSKSDTADTATVAKGIVAATKAGAHVINLSLGITGKSRVIAKAASFAAKRDVVLVAASGNHYRTGNAATFPAALPEVIAVGAIGRTGARASFSATGPHLDLVAPGVHIVSTIPGSGYLALSGTSMAAPHVSAAAALIRSVNPALDRTAVADVLKGTTESVAAGGQWNAQVGFGLLRADRAVRAAARIPGGRGGAQITGAVDVRVGQSRQRIRATVSPLPTAMLPRTLHLQRWRAALGDWVTVARSQASLSRGSAAWSISEGRWRVTATAAPGSRRATSEVIIVRSR